MTTPTSTRREKFVPAGTPFQLAQRKGSLLKALRRAATEHARIGANIERIAAKIEDDELDGTRGLHLLLDAKRLVGQQAFGGRVQHLTKALLGDYLSRRRVESQPMAAPVPEAKAPSRDPLAEATAIVRSAAGAVDEIDWSREPLTERERNIRAKMLNRYFDADPNSLLGEIRLHQLTFKAVMLRHHGRMMASDFASAVARAEELQRENKRRQNRAEIESAIADLDDAETGAA